MSVIRSAKPTTAFGRSLLSATDAATAMNAIAPFTTKGDLLVEQGGANVAAPAGGASSSNGDSTLPSYAFNGIEGTDSASPSGTGWRSNGNPAWLSNDLGSAQLIGSVRVLLGTGGTRQFAGFTLSWSDNNSTWTAVPGASIPSWAQDTTLNFNPISHRYWRLDFGNSSLGGDCIEWQIFSSLSAVRFPVGANGSIVQADSSAARGVSWTAPKLAVCQYAVSTVYTISTATLTDIDASNIVCTFTAPGSGKVMVEILGFFDTSAGTQGQFFHVGVRDGSTQKGLLATVLRAPDADGCHRSALIYVTGLTPGTSYTYKAAWAMDQTNAATGRLVVNAGTSTGGSGGPVIMTVEAA